jgi:small-conductance mechanosensitive channel
MSSNAFRFITIFTILGIIGVTLLLLASKEISEQNANSKLEPMSPAKKFRITARSGVGLWFIFVSLVGLYQTITRLQ